MEEQKEYAIFKRKGQWICYAIPPLTSQMAIYTKHKTKSQALEELKKEIKMVFKFKSAKQVLTTIHKSNGSIDYKEVIEDERSIA
tara:strand:- start:943 stop:1197 length:255 start_codon:yes stop_codon:yes gene_type:complete